MKQDCPLCRKSRPAKKFKPLYGQNVCKQCYYGFANRRQLAYIFDIFLIQAAFYATSFILVLLLVATFIFWWTNEARASLDVVAAVIEARVSTFVVGAFLIGFLPTWLLLRGSKWRLQRRIKTLEDAARSPLAPPPAAGRAPASTMSEAPAPAASPITADRAPGL